MAREMKDSGIEWIGEIPKEWEICRTKTYYTNKKEIVGNLEKEYERLALTLGGVIKRSKDDSTGLQPEAFEGYQILRTNELVFKLIDLANIQTSRIGYSPYTGIVSPAYIVLSPKEDYESKFGEYYFNSMWQRQIFNHMGDDGVRSSLNASDLLNIPYIKCDRVEKEKIVFFLDKKCAEIDSVISQTEKTIEEYKALKQSVITEAVTKGVRGSRPMKDSGIEWIGEIPEEWKVSRFKYVASVKSNLVEPEAYKDYPQVSPETIEKGSGKILPCRTVSEVGVISGNHLFYEGQIIYSKIRPKLNKVAIAPFDGLCSADMYPIETKLNKKFFLNAMLSDVLLQQVSLITENRVKMPKINQEELGNTWFAVPTSEEQDEIADYLDKKCAEIDKLIEAKQQLLTEMESYKKSVIYEYVTGKKEV